MNDSYLDMESRRAEQSRISANLLMRMNECLQESDQEHLFAPALSRARITQGNIRDGREIEQHQLDSVLEEILRDVPDILSLIHI